MSDSAKMTTVRNGLTLILWVTVISYLAAIIVAAFTVNMTDPAFASKVFRYAGICGTVGTVLVMGGKIMCLKVDSSVGANKLIVPAVLTSGFSMLVTITRYFLNVPSTITTVAQLSAIAGTVLFILFLQQLARHFRRDDLVRMAYIVLGLSVGLTALSQLAAVLFEQLPSIVSTLAMISILITVVHAVCYIRLVSNLKTSI